MGVGAGLYMCDVVKKFTFAISSPDEFLLSEGTALLLSEWLFLLFAARLPRHASDYSLLLQDCFSSSRRLHGKKRAVMLTSILASSFLHVPPDSWENGRCFLYASSLMPVTFYKGAHTHHFDGHFPHYPGLANSSIDFWATVTRNGSPCAMGQLPVYL